MDNSLQILPPKVEAIASPSFSRRQLLNFITGATIAITATPALYVVGKFCLPPHEATGAGGAILAKDILGNLIPATQILAKPPGTRALVAGLAGEPTYLIVKEDNTLDNIGLLDNCTHVAVVYNRISISPWTQTNPRTGEKPWWV